MFIRITNGQPEEYTIGQLRRDNPMVSFPKDIPEQTLHEYGVFRVQEIPRPAADPTKDIVELPPALVNGVWLQNWGEVPLTAGEIYARVLDAVRNARRDAYPSIEDQLDMIYWDMVNSTTQWSDFISSVKQTHPKPPSV